MEDRGLMNAKSNQTIMDRILHRVLWRSNRTGTVEPDVARPDPVM